MPRDGPLSSLERVTYSCTYVLGSVPGVKMALRERRNESLSYESMTPNSQKFTLLQSDTIASHGSLRHQ